MTVDEMLIPFRARWSFVQYIPNKPAKYGLKMFAVCDSKTFYVSHMELYCGKQPDGPYVKYIYSYMSVSSLPRTRAYWRSDIGVSNIRDAMTINDFEKIKNTLHFNDNNTAVEKGNPKYDKLHKIRPLINHLNNRFLSIPLESQLAIDEQICSTKRRNHMEQYLPMKPHKWGFKFYMLYGVSVIISKCTPDLGVTGNVVVRLARIVPKNLSYCIYFDNCYTSVPLMVHLANQGIYSLGTVRQNRIPNNKLLGEK